MGLTGFDAIAPVLDSLPRAGGLLLLAALLDWMIGDPWEWYHPVQAIGSWIQRVTCWILDGVVAPGEGSGDRYHRRSPTVERWGGVLLGVSTIAGTALVTWLIIQVAHRLHPVLGFALEAIALAASFAGRSLRDAAQDVLTALDTVGLEAGRSRLGHYVGRDTATLSKPEILRAVVETVAENAIDGVLAPLFWAILGAVVASALGNGGPGIIAAGTLGYKAASTLDSMVGYRRSPYTHVGWFSAQLEDRLTWLPCRLSVLTLALWSGQPRKVWAIARTDGPQDPSPNSGWSEAAYAAALGVQLGGENYYQGEKRIKPLLGAPNHPITAATVTQALQLTRRAFLGWLVLGMGLTVAISAHW